MCAGLRVCVRACARVPMHMRAREADVAQREQVDARNGLEQYCYNVRNTLSSSDELKDKIGEEDAQTIVTTVDEALVHLRKWPF